MNDLPVVVAWVVAVVNAGVVAVLWHRSRHLPGPSVSAWRRKAVMWLIVGAIIGPVIFVTAGVLTHMIFAWREVSANTNDLPGHIVGAIMFISIFDVAIALLFFAPAYLSVFLFWARIGPRLGWLERSFRGLAVGSMLLSFPAALGAVISYGIMDQPFGYKGVELLQFGGLIWLGTAISIFMPRRLIPSLRAGVFS